MNFWLLMYLIFAPVYVGLMIFWFNRHVIIRYWWLYKHPQTVYKLLFFYDNKMFSEKYISTTRSSFEFQGGTYFIEKDAVLRKNWFGIFSNTKFPINEENCLHFKHYKVFHKERYHDVPDKRQLIGELHYVFNMPNPIKYKSVEKLKDDLTKLPSSGGVSYDIKTAEDLNRVEKNSVLDQLLTAEFKKVTLMVLIVLCGMTLIAVSLLIGLRLEWIKTPLHAVCVNVGG